MKNLSIGKIYMNSSLQATLIKLRRIYRSTRREISWISHPLRQSNTKKYQAFIAQHAGERCFILGNGPSLAGMDLSPLKEEITFGMNRIYLLFPQIKFQTSYFVCVNYLVLKQFHEEIASLTMPKFLSWRGREYFNPTEDNIFLNTRPGVNFSYEPSKNVYGGATVTFVALQIAYDMGFKEVILIGVDHNFVSIGQPHETIVSEGEDPNHFAPNYFGKGVHWQLPDLSTSEQAYTLARDIYQHSNRKIFDATVDGKLTIFPKVSYSDLFS